LTMILLDEFSLARPHGHAARPKTND